jgi:NAD-dependent DNA ligase
MKQEYKNNDPVFIAKNIANFYEKIGAEGIREKIALKLIEETNVKTIPEVLKLTKTQLKDFGEKRIQLILDSNKIAKNASCIQLLVALNIFQGKLSFKRLEPMIKVVDPLKNYTQDMTQTLIEIKGVSNASAKLYLDGIKTFKEFIKETGLSCKSKSKSNIETDNRFESQVFLFSGVRDKQVEECIKLFGGKVVERFTKSEKVTTLVVKDTNASTSKIQQAKNENIQIISIEDMRKKCLK